MPSPITEEAIQIIDSARSRGPLVPTEYAQELPPRAGALARLLLDKRIVDDAAKYQVADASAVRWRRLYTFLASTGLCVAFLSVVLGAIRLYFAVSASAASIEWVRPYLGWSQWVLLAITVICVSTLFVLQPARRWFRARAEAEQSRLRLFRLLMSGSSGADATEAPLLPLQLECFRRHLLENERVFFHNRSRQYRRAVNVGKLLGAIALAFICLASLPQLVSSLSELGALSWIPEAVERLVRGLLADKKLYALAWLCGISLQLLATKLVIISPVARHAERYEMMNMLLDLDPWQISGVRVAAASGAREPVQWFSDSVLRALAAETKMWSEQEEQKPGR
jgi:hypothetical protein